MNQLVTVDPRANLELAKAFAEAKLVPEHFRKSIGDCYIAINLANRYGMEPWILMQEMYIISGKPMMSGKLVTAILNNSLAEPLRPEYSGDGEDRMITLTGRPHDSEPLIVTLKVRDAKTTNAMWTKMPDQMLMYAASRMWGRRYTPDLILGILFDDEEVPGVKDPPLVPPKPTTQFAQPEPSRLERDRHRDDGHPEIIDPVTGEVLDHPVTLSVNTNEKPYDWGVRFVAAVRTSRDIDTADKWLAANADTLADFANAVKNHGNTDLAKSAVKVHGNIIAAINEHKLKLVDREEAGR